MKTIKTYFDQNLLMINTYFEIANNRLHNTNVISGICFLSNCLEFDRFEKWIKINLSCCPVYCSRLE